MTKQLFFVFAAAFMLTSCRYDPNSGGTSTGDASTTPDTSRPDTTTPDASKPDTRAADSTTSDTAGCTPAAPPAIPKDCSAAEWDDYLECEGECADAECSNECYSSNLSNSCQICLVTAYEVCAAADNGCASEWAATSCCMQANGCTGTDTTCNGKCTNEADALLDCAAESCPTDGCIQE